MSSLQQLTPDEIKHLLGGRKHYNAVRRLRALHRRLQVIRMVDAGNRPSEIARILGVHRTTIWRDLNRN